MTIYASAVANENKDKKYLCVYNNIIMLYDTYNIRRQKKSARCFEGVKILYSPNGYKIVFMTSRFNTHIKYIYTPHTCRV